MSEQRTFEGTATGSNYQEALEKALHHMREHLAEGGVTDPSAEWVVKEVSGQCRGLIKPDIIRVQIAAVRTPPWESR